MEFVLHAGVQHPNLLWIVVTAVVSFALGTGFGAFYTRSSGERPADAEATKS